jgi:sporulation protein YlmC with PRC-barrel domain
MPATDRTQFTIGAEAICSDGTCGEVSRVVVDPVAKAVTHLVIEPKHGIARLVPLELVDTTTDGVELRCTEAEFDKLDAAQETEFLQRNNGYDGYGPDQTLYWPYYGIGTMGAGGLGMGMNMGAGIGMSSNGGASERVTTDTVPAGEVDVRRGETVHATDGEIGKVKGLVINPEDHRVTHVLLQEGHLWGRQDVAIPIDSVTSVDHGIRLKISKQQVKDLPPVEIDQTGE